mmetsp:Transcript_117882/g.380458  ORF Transcript_117882/g.380458 Transcript_117882/m.380458 type:complete len:307 (+) Transcript_117882:991-1911(+)
MLLGDADVECPLRPEALLEDADARAAGHGRGDGHDLLVGLRLPHERLRKDLCERRRLGLRGRRGRRLGDVELGAHGVELVARLLRGQVTLALLRLHVQEDGLLQGSVLMLSLDVREHLDQRLHVVAIDGAHVVEAQLLEELALAARAAALEGHRLHEVPGVLVQLRSGRGELAWQQRLGGGLGKLPCALECARRLDARNVVLDAQACGWLRARERLRERPDRRLDLVVEGRQRDLAVVIEDHHHLGLQASGVVHGLPGHAARNRSVANDGHTVARPPHAHAGLLEAHRSTDGRGRVPSAKGVVHGL